MENIEEIKQEMKEKGLKREKGFFLIFCERRDIRRDDGKPYLDRFTIFECPLFSLKIHTFHDSDDQCLHDHPWPFITFILKNGYNEVTPPKDSMNEKDMILIANGLNIPMQKRFIKPLTINFRPAKWIHRVELIENNGEKQKAITFVITFKRIRKWGFYTKNGWILWKDYSQKLHCD